MPKQKDLKRLIRARMEKTGESYTAARAHLVGGPARGASGKSDEAPTPLPEDYEKVAGMSDDAVREATGRSWPEWASFLDAQDAASWEHRKIADFVYEHGGDVSGWWSQMVTVAYERFRGLREVGQRRGGGYDVNRSRTIGVPLAELWNAFADEERRSAWLDDADLAFHHMAEPKSMRGRYPDGTKVDVYFTAKGEEKSSVSVQHREHPDREAADRARAASGARLDRLKALLTG